MSEQPQLSARDGRATGARPRAGQAEGHSRIGGSFPLSHGQQAIWFAYRFAPESWAYNIVWGARIRSLLDVPALRRAFQTLVDRHTALRTVFGEQDGRPFQIALPRQAVRFEEVDASGWTEQALHRSLTDASHRPFDLERGPVLRTYLYRHASEHILQIVVHHIAADLWSLIVLLRELRVLYAAERRGRAVVLPPLPIEYQDYVRWQEELLRGPEGDRLWAYWREQLAGGLPALAAPADYSRPPTPTYRGASHAFAFPADLVVQLREVGRRADATLFMTLLAAFATLLHRYSGQEDIVLGSAMAGRTRAPLRGLVGYFMNPVVLRQNLSGDPTFADLLRRVKATVLDALDNQDYPLGLLVERLRLNRDHERPALFQAMFVFLQQERMAELGGLVVPSHADLAVASDEFELEPLALAQQEGQFELTLEIAESRTGATGLLKYQIDLFKPDTIGRMTEHFLTLLTGIAADSQQRLSVLPLLSESDRQDLLVNWSGAPATEALDLCVHQLVEAQAARTPDRIAAACDGEDVTYAELERRANRLAAALVQQGAGRERPVAVLDDRGVNLLAAILAVLKAGGVYLPLDPRDPARRIARSLEHAGAGLALVGQRCRVALAEALATMPEAGPRVRTLDIEETLGQQAPDCEVRSGCRRVELAYVIYTSGSTGIPKGAMIEHRGLVNHLMAKVSELRLTAADVVAQNASQCFDISIWQFFAALVVGGRVEIVPDAVALDPRRLLRLIAERGVTVLEVVPSLLRALLDEMDGARNELPSLRWLIPTGEALPPQLCARWLGHLPGVPLMNAYGPTECSDDVAHFVVVEPPSAGATRVPIGRPIRGIRLYVLDPALNPVPVGGTGELYVGGVGVGRGYLHDPARTAEAFIPDPYGAAPGARLYRTGDLARFLPSGDIEFLGRHDQQVKVRGFRIELGEIEAVLLQHPGVRECVVRTRETGRGDQQIVAYLVAGLPPPAAADLRGFMRERVPGHMIPSAFVLLEAMPTTPNGKLDQRALPAPTSEEFERATAYEPARTPLERLVASLCMEVLGAERVGLNDNFFELGGHSLLASQLLSRVRDIFRIDVPLRRFFEAPTAAALSAVLAELETTPGLVMAVARAWTRIEEMSGDEVQTLLDAKRVEGQPQHGD